MTEKEFIEKNKESWKRLEYLLTASKVNPSELQTLFAKVSGDLSYARTFFPNRSVKLYLNQLMMRVFNKIKVAPKRNLKDKVIHFYAERLPELIIRHKEAFFLAFGVFLLAVLIGVFSTLHDDQFASQILGDSYVHMTERNINNEDPMNVYKDPDKTDMFLGITINNIRVAFLTFVLGIFGGLGSVFVLLSNGIMVGVFQTFFFTKGLFLESFLTIWIHGTIEISSIVIAGAAGLIIGKGLFFPGTYDRKVALRFAAKEGLLVLLSIVPLLLMAGFLEGFVTRLTDLPTAIKVLIIGSSFLFMTMVFIVSPLLYFRSGKYVSKPIALKQHHNKVDYKKESLFQEAMSFLVTHNFEILFFLIVPLIVYYAIVIYATNYFGIHLLISIIESDSSFIRWNTNIFFIHFIAVVYTILVLGMILKGTAITLNNLFSLFRKHLPMLLLIGLILTLILLIQKPYIFILAIFLLPVNAISKIISELGSNSNLHIIKALDYIKKDYSYKHKSIVDIFILYIIYFALSTAMNTSVIQFIKEFFSWHSLSSSFVNNAIYTIGFKIVVFICILSLAIKLLTLRFRRNQNILESYDLIEEFEHFNNRTAS